MGAGIGVVASAMRRAPAENGEQRREQASHVMSAEAGHHQRAASDPVVTPVPRGASLALGTLDLGRATAQQQSSDDGALAIWPHGYHIHGLGGFVVHRLVNQGAFGQVYEVHRGADPDHHNYALKRVRWEHVIRPGFASLKSEARAMIELAREAMLMLAVATPRHPGVTALRYCALLESHAPTGSTSEARAARRGEFVVLTEWLGDDTIDLERAIRSRALYRRDRKSLDGMRRASAADDENDTPTDMSVTATRCLALAVMLQIAEALAHVHARGVLHQDVKPANVLISGLLACRRGDDVTTRVIVKLTDFGLSRRGVGPGRKGELQAPLGGMTPAFQSPEIAAHIRRCATEPSEKPLLLSPSSHDLWAWALTALAIFSRTASAVRAPSGMLGPRGAPADVGTHDAEKAASAAAAERVGAAADALGRLLPPPPGWRNSADAVQSWVLQLPRGKRLGTVVNEAEKGMNDGTRMDGAQLRRLPELDIATRWCLPKGLSPVVCLSLSAPAPRMKNLLARCFRADAKQRPSSFDDVVKELRACVEAEQADSGRTEPVPTKSASIPRCTPRQHRRRSVDEHNAAEASIALSNIGVALRQHGRSDAACAEEAEHAFREAIRLDESNLTARVCLGAALADPASKGHDGDGATSLRVHEAEQCYRTVIRQAKSATEKLPVEPGGGRVHHHNTDRHEMSELMIDAHHNLGLLLMRKEDYDGARDEFSIALSYSPNRADILTALGRLHKALGNMSEAASCWRKIIAAAEQEANSTPRHDHDSREGGATRHHRAPHDEITPRHRRTSRESAIPRHHRATHEGTTPRHHRSSRHNNHASLAGKAASELSVYLSHQGNRHAALNTCATGLSFAPDDPHLHRNMGVLLERGARESANSIADDHSQQRVAHHFRKAASGCVEYEGAPVVVNGGTVEVCVGLWAQVPRSRAAGARARNGRMGSRPGVRRRAGVSQRRRAGRAAGRALQAHTRAPTYDGISL